MVEPRSSPDYQGYHHNSYATAGMMMEHSADESNQNNVMAYGGPRVGDKHEDDPDDDEDVYGHLQPHHHHHHHQPTTMTTVQPEEVQRPTVIEQRHFIECT